MERSKRGISLIVLVITVIVLSILAATVVISINNINIIEQTKDAVFKNDMASYKELYSFYLADMLMEDANFSSDELNVKLGDTEFSKIFGENVKTEHKSNLQIVNGKLTYTTEDIEEAEVLKGMGIEYLAYSPDDWFVNCTIPEYEEIQGYDGIIHSFQSTLPGSPCFDSATGTIYSVNLPDGVTEITIPKEINGVKVTQIKGAWGNNYAYTFMPGTLSKVGLPEGITLNGGAFAGVNQQTKIELITYSPVLIRGEGKAINTDSKVVIAENSWFVYGGFNFINFELAGTVRDDYYGITTMEGMKISENEYQIPREFKLATNTNGLANCISGLASSSKVYMTSTQLATFNYTEQADGTYRIAGNDDIIIIVKD